MVKARDITTPWLLRIIGEAVELETHGKLIVLESKTKRSITITHADGRRIIKRWRIHVTEDEG